MKTDSEIAHETKLVPITTIAEKIHIPVEDLELYGKYIAKVPYSSFGSKKN
jgi:formate--tetrahydrofolate ligase